MINYRSHSVEEFASDEMFRRWVTDPTPELTFFWNRWTDENPDRLHVISLARELVLSVNDIYKDDLTDEMLRHEIEEITRIAEERKHNRRLGSYLPAVWKAAAAILLVSGLGIGYYHLKQTEKQAAAVNLPEAGLSEMEVRTNNDQAEMTVLLSDKSVATLSKGSSIRYPKKFGPKERRVYLKGEAFFDVSKNEHQPFLVYTNETVTKVLGTSFRVKAFDEESTVLVAVKTGRVSVFPKQDYEDAEEAAAEQKSGIVLSPNEQAVFIRKENRLERGNVSRPEILVESIVRKDQIFDDKPVSEVLQDLQKVYGIQIRYDAGILAQCRINAVCQAIGATYEMVDGQIVITSEGCI